MAGGSAARAGIERHLGKPLLGQGCPGNDRKVLRQHQQSWSHVAGWLSKPTRQQ